MEDLLTTRQVQDFLKVDRITIYRMLQDGRIRGVKIGQQWRFSRREIERMVEMQVPRPEPAQSGQDTTFPAHCIQTIQDLFSEVGQISTLMINQQGEPLTQVSRSCGFCQAILSTSFGRDACQASWRELAHRNDGTKSFTCHAGLNYVIAPVWDQGQQIGSFLVGQFYWQAPDPHAQAERARALATACGLRPEVLQRFVSAVPVIGSQQHSRLKSWPFSAARAVESILSERTGYIDRLRQIATLTHIS